MFWLGVGRDGRIAILEACPQYVPRIGYELGAMQRVTGHVFRVERKRGPVWYAKYRLPSGRQVQKLIGPAWDGAGSAGGGVLHEARGGGLAAFGSG